MTDDRPNRSARAPGPAWLAALVLLQLAALLPYALSGLLAPTYGVVLLLATWLVLTVVAARTLRRHGALGFAVPVLTVAVWVLVVTAGGLLAGWTPSPEPPLLLDP